MNVQHDCYSCKCSGISHRAVQQEREKTSRTRATVDHKPDARFVVNIHSIHNYKLILAVTPPDLLMPPTGVDSDTVALRTRAAQLLRGEVNVTHPGADGDVPTSLPFDRTHGKSQAAPQDANTTFAGTLSSQSKSTLMAMAAALSIPVTEKARKQELPVKIRDYLDANPDIRNSTRFAQVTWRSANRNQTTPAASTPASGALCGAAIPLPQQVFSHIPSHTTCPPFHISQMHVSMAGLPALVNHPMPSTSSLHMVQEPFLYYPPPVTPAPYLIQPYTMHTYHQATAPATHQGHHHGALDNFYRTTD